MLSQQIKWIIELCIIQRSLLSFTPHNPPPPPTTTAQNPFNYGWASHHSIDIFTLDFNHVY